MASNIYTAGLNNVGSYQVSGIPYATGSVGTEEGATINFPYVTSWITLYLIMILALPRHNQIFMLGFLTLV